MADLTEATRLLDQLLGMGVPGFDCIVYHRGREIYRHFGGHRDEAGAVPMNGREIYNFYSCTKVVTCAAALRLVEQGRMHLDDPLFAYLPEFTAMQVREEGKLRPAARSITLRDLFTMRSGMNYDTLSPAVKQCQADTDGACPTREFMHYLAREPLKFDPGTHWHYSLSHDVLAAVVEVVSGMRFSEYLRRELFAPAGAERLGFALTPEQEADVACQSIREKGQVRFVERDVLHFRFGREYESGGAGLRGDAESYARFMEALRSGMIISPAMLDLMCTDQLTPAQRAESFYPDYGYGLGVRCPIPGSPTDDFGWNGMAGAQARIDRGRELCFFCALHQPGAPIEVTWDQVYPEVIRAISR